MRVYIKKYDDKNIAVACEYNTHVVSALRNLPQKQWIPNQQIWVIPDTQKNVNFLLENLYNTNLFSYPICSSENEKVSNFLTKKSPHLDFEKYEELLITKHYSPRTIDSYRKWLRAFSNQFINIPSNELSQKEINIYLSELATKKKVSSSTQNQALAALLF